MSRGTVPRRPYEDGFKHRVVTEVRAPDTLVAEVAKRHGLNANLDQATPIIEDEREGGHVKCRERLPGCPADGYFSRSSACLEARTEKDTE